MKILTNGSCMARGSFEGGWPDILEEKFNHEVTNISLYGAGNDYVLKTTVDQLLKNRFDLVIIMFPHFSKLDIEVADPENYSNVRFTSRNQIIRLKKLYQARRYARAKKRFENYKDIVYKPLDTNIFQDHWIFSWEYYSAESNLPTNYIDLFNDYFASTYSEIKRQNLYKVIKLQEILKQKNQPYLFCFATRPTGFYRFSDQYKLIDWNNVFHGVYPKQLALAMNSYNKKLKMATYPAHEAFAELLVNRIQKMS
jgi:hypothetical protein